MFINQIESDYTKFKRTLITRGAFIYYKYICLYVCMCLQA